ncbi:hypothetical protein SDC9_191999 [bioreactor metagenome]|uniref:Uncharacterized protein n=1 Tax=bioreactor metagenome TaxID=1076179 RepID=A0A645I7Z0_9ZZZZ
MLRCDTHVNGCFTHGHTTDAMNDNRGVARILHGQLLQDLSRLILSHRAVGFVFQTQDGCSVFLIAHEAPELDPGAHPRLCWTRDRGGNLGACYCDFNAHDRICLASRDWWDESDLIVVVENFIRAGELTIPCKTHDASMNGQHRVALDQ